MSTSQTASGANSPSWTDVASSPLTPPSDPSTPLDNTSQTSSRSSGRYSLRPHPRRSARALSGSPRQALASSRKRKREIEAEDMVPSGRNRTPSHFHLPANSSAHQDSVLQNTTQKVQLPRTVSHVAVSPPRNLLLQLNISSASASASPSPPSSPPLPHSLRRELAELPSIRAVLPEHFPRPRSPIPASLLRRPTRCMAQDTQDDISNAEYELQMLLRGAQDAIDRWEAWRDAWVGAHSDVWDPRAELDVISPLEI